MTFKDKFKAIKDILLSNETDVNAESMEYVTDKGVMVVEAGLEVGNAVAIKVVNAETNESTLEPIEDGDYVLENGTVVTVKDNLIESIKEVETAMADETTETETETTIDETVEETEIEVLKGRLTIIEETVVSLADKLAEIEGFIAGMKSVNETVETQMSAIETKLSKIAGEPVNKEFKQVKTAFSGQSKKLSALEELSQIRKTIK